MELKDLIRDVPDFPKKGIIFKDITTLLKSPKGLKNSAEELHNFAKNKGITKVAGIESRGFILGGIIAEKLNAGFIPIRKPGKLPSEKISESYLLEYGSDSIEIHKDAIQTGDKVLLHDDLLATGGTMEAACKLIEKLGGEVVQISFLIELDFLNGREKLKSYDVRSIIQYGSE
ncbi:MAG: adenine phosphoribosyltransferase [Melioribacteraceae bacterium]